MSSSVFLMDPLGLLKRPRPTYGHYVFLCWQFLGKFILYTFWKNAFLGGWGFGGGDCGCSVDWVCFGSLGTRSGRLQI